MDRGQADCWRPLPTRVGLTFPLRLAFESGAKTSGEVWIGVALSQGGTRIGESEAVIPVVPGRVTQLTLRVGPYSRSSDLTVGPDLANLAT